MTFNIHFILHHMVMSNLFHIFIFEHLHWSLPLFKHNKQSCDKPPGAEVLLHVSLVRWNSYTGADKLKDVNSLKTIYIYDYGIPGVGQLGSERKAVMWNICFSGKCIILSHPCRASPDFQVSGRSPAACSGKGAAVLEGKRRKPQDSSWELRLCLNSAPSVGGLLWAGCIAKAAAVTPACTRGCDMRGAPGTHQHLPKAGHGRKAHRCVRSKLQLESGQRFPILCCFSFKTF